MVGKIFITRSGYDPQVGKHVKDPFLGDSPSLGACRPDVRKKLKEGDHLFTVSGKVPHFNQYLMGGFEIDSKIDALQAFERFPENRLQMREDGQLTGNIIIDVHGKQHKLDDHSGFENRIKNYIVGRNLLALSEPDEIAEGRRLTLQALQDILHKNGKTPFAVVGRFGTNLHEEQIMQLRGWLASIKGRVN
jgi:hypothetical protein